MMETYPCLSCVSFPWHVRLQIYTNLQYQVSFLGGCRKGKTPQAGWNFSLLGFIFSFFPELYEIYPELYYINKGLKHLRKD